MSYQEPGRIESGALRFWGALRGLLRRRMTESQHSITG